MQSGLARQREVNSQPREQTVEETSPGKRKEWEVKGKFYVKEVFTENSVRNQHLQAGFVAQW